MFPAQYVVVLYCCCFVVPLFRCFSHVPLFRGIPTVSPVFCCFASLPFSASVPVFRSSVFRSSVIRCSWFYSMPFFFEAIIDWIWCTHRKTEIRNAIYLNGAPRQFICLKINFLRINFQIKQYSPSAPKKQQLKMANNYHIYLHSFLKKSCKIGP